MDRTTGAFERHTYDKTQPGKLSRPPIRNILSYTDDFITFINEDATKKIWIGTMSGGINRYDPVTQKMTFFNETTDPASGLTADCCYFTSFVSRDSVFWIAAWLGDLFKTDPYLNKIPFTPIDEYLNGIIKTNRDVFWSYGNGLTRKDVKTGLQKKYSHDPGNRNSLGYNDISHIEIGKNNTWWISTYGGGLDAFDPQTASFTHYNHDPQNKNSISDNVVSIVCEDGENLWIGTRRGLDLMNVTTGKFSHFIHSETDPNNDRNIKIHGIYVKNKETIWMATANARGMSVLNTTNGNIRKYYLEGKFISCIFRDHRDVVWAATDDGLFRYDAKTDVFSRFSDPHRFTKIGAVEQVQEDDKKNLWVFTRSAIHKISPNRDFINTYGSEYGVQKINAWLGIKFVTAPKGEIYFIDRNGYFSFKEEDVTYNPFPPQIIIRDIQIKGDSTLHSNAEQKFLINQQELVLAHHQNTFSIAFTPIHFANPQKNKIIFKLDGIDTDWRESGNERTAYYFNLPPGAYTFRLKACNATGVLSEKQFAITITPPGGRPGGLICSMLQHLFFQ
ncbi:MAG: hypothetical protein IPL27_06705 [Lewinellaceae bacterium]|nr:hypothetical protein [Lewinellaceae bacterium]